MGAGRLLILFFARDIDYHHIIPVNTKSASAVHTSLSVNSRLAGYGYRYTELHQNTPSQCFIALKMK